VYEIAHAALIAATTWPSTAPIGDYDDTAGAVKLAGEGSDAGFVVRT
jgi:hypothetical protein